VLILFLYVINPHTRSLRLVRVLSDQNIKWQLPFHFSADKRQEFLVSHICQIDTHTWGWTIAATPHTRDISVIFKVSNLSLFDIGNDLRLNSLEEIGDDTILAKTSNDPLGVSIESILRSKIKWIQEEFNGLSQKVCVKNI
jgi:hypothetical protein